MDNTLRFIGRINSGLRTKEECPLQEFEGAPEAEIAIFPEFIEGVQNLVEGSDVILLTWLHQADRSVIKCIPRKDYDAPLIGVFSTRSPDRPNPVGLHRVKIRSISDKGLIRVSGLEVVDGTPLIDIKPVLQS